MLVEQSYGYSVIEKIEDIDFGICFMYQNESMAIEYSSLEKVFCVSRRESESHFAVVVSSLDLSTEDKQRKLLELIKDGSLLEIAEANGIEEYFEVNNIHVCKYFVDSLSSEYKDELLLTFLLKEKRLK